MTSFGDICRRRDVQRMIRGSNRGGDSYRGSDVPIWERGGSVRLAMNAEARSLASGKDIGDPEFRTVVPSQSAFARRAEGREGRVSSSKLGADTNCPDMLGQAWDYLSDNPPLFQRCRQAQTTERFTYSVMLLAPPLRTSAPTRCRQARMNLPCFAKRSRPKIVNRGDRQRFHSGRSLRIHCAGTALPDPSLKSDNRLDHPDRKTGRPTSRDVRTA